MFVRVVQCAMTLCICVYMLQNIQEFINEEQDFPVEEQKSG